MAAGKLPGGEVPFGAILGPATIMAFIAAEMLTTG